MSDKKALTPEQIESLANTCAESEPVYREFVGSLASPAAGHNHSFHVIYGLHDALQRLRPASLELDHYKRALTYGEKLRINPLANLNGPIGERPIYWADHKEQVHGLSFEQRADLIHGILGIITEALELAPVLQQLLAGEEIDKTNLVEEIGDGKFYTALAETAAGYEPGQVVFRNVTKLGQRYKGDVFNVDGALNRNLDAERVALGDVHNPNHPAIDRPQVVKGQLWKARESDDLNLIAEGDEVEVSGVGLSVVDFRFSMSGGELSLSRANFTKLFEHIDRT